MSLATREVHSESDISCEGIVPRVIASIEGVMYCWEFDYKL
jgi:hypothetical protein